MPKVSVLMPAYNHVNLIGAAIESVLNQTFKDLELIIVDDASTDGTPDVVARYTDPRIKFTRLSVNTMGDSHRICMEQATGDYWATISSDDEWYLNKLEKQVSHLETNPNTAAVFSLVTVTDTAKNIITNHPYHHVFQRTNRPRQDWLNHFFFIGNCVCHSSVLIRKLHLDDVINTVGPIDWQLCQVGDYDLWMKICLRYDIFVIQEPLIYFKLHANNTSGLTTAARNRVPYEMTKLCKNYLKIQSVDDLVKIFPNIGRFGYPLEQELIPFLVSLEAYYVGAYPYRLFAVDTIYDMMKNPITKELLRVKCNYGRKQFTDLTADKEILPFGK